MKYRDEAFPNIPFGHSAYDVETKGMTHEEKGVYVDLMILVWRRKCEPIPDNDEKISRMIGCTLDRWKRKLRPAVEHLFIISEEGWRHERMEQRWAGIEEKSALAAEKGRLGGRPPNRQTASSFPNPLTDSSEAVSQIQTTNPLKNNETEKAGAFVQVKQNESSKIESKKEESKKESPLNPPHGGTANGVLFPVQEVQHAPPKSGNPKKSRGRGSKPLPVPEEIFEAYWELRPPSESKSHHNKTAARTNFAKAMQSGVDPQEMVQAYANYREEAKYKGKFGTDYVKSAQRFIALDERKWEQHTSPFTPPRHNGSNVTPLRNGTNGQPMPKQTRGGIQY
jgi:uncharacterized protein YdaU (DUF1376 family)